MPPGGLKVASLFSGAGGLDLGLHQAGHELLLLCDSDAGARQVLRSAFPGVRIHDDVTSLERLPEETELLVAGFPCVDVSRAGLRRGLEGQSTGLVRHVFRLLQQAKDDRRPVPWVLLENVEALLDRHSGKPPVMQYCTRKLVELGYQSWAYRVVNSAGFGLPNRRRRVFLVASLHGDARDVLLSQGSARCTGGCEALFGVGRRCYPCHANELRNMRRHARASYALDMGNAMSPAGEDVVPTFTTSNDRMLLLLGDGASGMLRLEDAERLQGMEEGHTRPCWPIQTPGVAAHRSARRDDNPEAGASKRWDLLGNAVTVPVARWLGERLAQPYQYKYHGVGTQDRPLDHLLNEGAAPEAALATRPRSLHVWSHVATDQLQDALVFEYLSLSLRRQQARRRRRDRERAASAAERLLAGVEGDGALEAVSDGEGASSGDDSGGSGDEGGWEGVDAEAAEALQVARAASKAAAAQRAQQAQQTEQAGAEQPPEGSPPRPPAPHTPREAAAPEGTPSSVAAAPRSSGSAGGEGSTGGSRQSAATAAGEGEAATDSEPAGTPSPATAPRDGAAAPALTPGGEATESGSIGGERRASTGLDDVAAAADAPAAKEAARAEARAARVEAEAEQRELFQAAILRKKQRGQVQQSARQQAWWDREAWPRAAWYVRGLGCFGCEEMSECPVPTPFIPLGEFVDGVGRAASQEEIHTYLHRMREKGWDVGQTIEKLLQTGARLSSEAHEVVRIPGLLTDADMIGDVVWVYDKTVGCWWPGEKLDPLAMPAGRDLPAGAVKALSATEKLVSLPQYQKLAEKVTREQRQESRRVLVWYLPVSSGQWQWYRPSDCELFEGNTVREGEAFALIKSNGGRWKHGEEMGRAIKDARASLHIKHNRNCLEADRMRRTRASAAAGAVNLKQRCGQCKTCMNNLAGQRRYDCLTQRMRAAALSGHAGAQVAVNGEGAVGARVSVWWEGDQRFYSGLLALYDPVATDHTVCYDDGEVGMHRLWQHDERIRLETPVERWPRDAALARHRLQLAQEKLREGAAGRRGAAVLAPPPAAPAAPEDRAPAVTSAEELRRKNREAFEVLFGRAAKGLEATGSVPDLTPEEQEVVAAAQQAARAAAGQAAHRPSGRRGVTRGRAEPEDDEPRGGGDLQQEILAAFGEGWGGAGASSRPKRGATPASADEGGPSIEPDAPPLKRGRFQALEKCGDCKHCLNPRLKKACKVVLLQRKALLGLRGV